jgi:hypothetical protein
MKQLSGLDASFLYMETGSQFGHVSSVSIYERPDDPTYDPYTAWRDQIERRLHLLEPLRRRLRVVPFGLDHPFWIEDSAFDLDFHVRHNALPPPGSDEQLAELTSRIIGRPMDRDRPLWESTSSKVCRRTACDPGTKVHHATIDGASGASCLAMMLTAIRKVTDRSADPGGTAPRPERRRDDRPCIGLASAQARSSDAAHDPHGARARKATCNPALVGAATRREQPSRSARCA